MPGVRSTLRSPRRKNNQFPTSIFMTISSKSLKTLTGESGSLYQVLIKNGLDRSLIISKTNNLSHKLGYDPAKPQPLAQLRVTTTGQCHYATAPGASWLQLPNQCRPVGQCRRNELVKTELIRNNLKTGKHEFRDA